MNIKQMIEEEVTIHNAKMYHIFRSSDYHKEVKIENERFISKISNAIQESIELLPVEYDDTYERFMIIKEDLDGLFKGEDNE